MRTLHRYVLRELLKNFGLTVAALTALFTMGGGLLNAVRGGGAVGVGDLLKILPLLLPIVVTFTMPLAALFSATITYGRLAADNEITACRAAGINVSRLFAPALWLAAAVTVITLISSNLVIPDFMGRVERYVRSNLRNIAFEKLQREGYIGKDGAFYVTAERVELPTDESLVRAGFPVVGFDYMSVFVPTLLQIDRAGNTQRFTTADFGLVQFDRRGDDVAITLIASNARDFEVGKRAVQLKQQTIGPIPFHVPIQQKEAWMDVWTLLRWRHEPWHGPRVVRPLADFLARYQQQLFFAAATDALSRGGPLVFSGHSGERLTVTATRVEAAERGGEPKLHNVRIEIADPGSAGVKVITAPSGWLALRLARSDVEIGIGSSTSDEPQVAIRLLGTEQEQVVERTGRPGEFSNRKDRDQLWIEGLRMPTEVAQRVAEATPARVLDARVALELDERATERRLDLLKKAQKFLLRVDATIHFRLAYAASALVTIIMGAMLGVIFRGSRALAAFGLACIPFGVATIVVFMGRQLAESPATSDIGPAVIWGGLGAVGLIDALILQRGIRR